MPHYYYKAVGLDGRSTEGEALAATPQALAGDLAGRGLLLTSHRCDVQPRKFLTSVATDQRVATRFIAELAMVLRSGLPIDEALELLARGASGALAQAILATRADLQSGETVSQAFQRQAAAFGRELGPLAKVAETTGDLQGMLSGLAEQRQRDEQLRDKVIAALRYPLFLVIAAVSVLLFFLMHVIPQFASLLKDAHSDPGGMVRMTMGLSEFIVTNQLRLGIAAICVLAAILGALRSSVLRERLREAACLLPGVRGTLELWRASTLLLNLALLSAQNVPLNTTIQLLEGIVAGSARESMRRVGDKVRRGERLHSALSNEKLLPPLALRMLAIGERTGELAQVAREGGHLYALKLDLRLSRFAAVIGPVAILTIASLIGGMMVMIMTVLTSVNQMIM